MCAYSNWAYVLDTTVGGWVAGCMYVVQVQSNFGLDNFWELFCLHM